MLLARVRCRSGCRGRCRSTRTPPSAQQRHHDPVAVAGQRLVDRVVDDLPDQVVQAALTGRADVHARALADRLEALEDLDRGGVVRRPPRRVGCGGLGHAVRLVSVGGASSDCWATSSCLAARGTSSVGRWDMQKVAAPVSVATRSPILPVERPGIHACDPGHGGHPAREMCPDAASQSRVRAAAQGVGWVPIRPRGPQIGRSAGPGAACRLSRRCRADRGRRGAERGPSSRSAACGPDDLDHGARCRGRAPR